MRFVTALLGAFVLTVGCGLASTVVFDQSNYDTTVGFRSSNTLTNGNPVTGTGSTQQIADDFTVSIPGMQVTQVNLWFVYQFGLAPAADQAMVLRVWDDAGGAPGAIIFEESVSILPVSTGEFNSFFDTATQQTVSREIFMAEISLTTPLYPEAGERYWLNPMGDDDDVTWGWQFSDPASGERYSRYGNALDPTVWRPFAGDLAFSIIVPEPSGALLLAAGGLLVGLRRRRRSFARAN